MSIWKGGQMVLNRDLLERRELADATHVQLLYDAEGKRIALKPFPKKEPHAYSLQRVSNRGIINAGKFLQHYGIEHKQSAQYKSEWDESLQVLVVDLKEKV